MLTLPQEIMITFAPFIPIFNHRIWDLVQVLTIGAILAPGKRTVSSVLHISTMCSKKRWKVSIEILHLGDSLNRLAQYRKQMQRSYMDCHVIL